MGVFITNDLKWNKQCTVAAMKANRILGQIRNSFKNLNRESLRFLYTSLVRPHLEYAVGTWSPYLKKDIIILEKMQRRVTKLIDYTRTKSYEDRLKNSKIVV